MPKVPPSLGWGAWTPGLPIAGLIGKGGIREDPTGGLGNPPRSSLIID